MTVLGGCFAENANTEVRCQTILAGQSLFGGKRTILSANGVTLGIARPDRGASAACDVACARCGPVTLAFDGRIDDREGLISFLGVATSTEASDGELVAAVLARNGVAGLDQIVGEFALAWFDQRDASFRLARDIGGFRPLCYRYEVGRLDFASMPSGLEAVADLRLSIDPDFAAERLALLPWDDERTWYHKVARVIPGHVVTIKDGSVSTVSFWRPNLEPMNVSRAECLAGLRDVLDRGVRSHLRGVSGAVGSHLSAGLDSSIVTATAAVLRPNLAIHAFTAVPPAGTAGAPYPALADEGEAAAKLALRFPNVRHERIETEGSPFAAMDATFRFEQQPADNICNSVWGRRINARASALGIDVMLTGGFGNFSVTYDGMGYPAELLGAGRFIRLLQLAIALRHEKPLSATLLRALRPYAPAGVWQKVRDRLKRRRPDPTDFLTIEQRVRLARNVRFPPTTNAADERLAMLRYHDGGNYYKGVWAEYGISLREPMKDKRVIEYCLRVPPVEYCRGGLRSLAKEAFAERLGQSARNPAGYQAANWREMIASDAGTAAMELGFAGRSATVRSAVDPDFLERCLQSLPAKWGSEDEELIYRWGLLRTLSFTGFARRVDRTN